MHARMTNPAILVPDAMEALQALGAAIGKGGVPSKTITLVLMRASQINGCGTCLVGHARSARQEQHETDDRLAALAGWRDAPFYTEAERAALALTESVTRLSDCSDPVPDAIWEEVSRHYDEIALGTLVLAIANINVWNRLNVATRQIAGGSW
jgi:AhpD family alkylhydroperoxidase